ncbi:MAG: hypothetical protein HZA91_06590 [Verrucomicrobia bacterium]|nr:hypothetical protein [Verrucomicrobiota bacterium]
MKTSDANLKMMGRAKIAAGLMCLAAGCATTKPKAAKGPIFYPPAPNPPRLQFLVAYSDSEKFRENATSFQQFVVGATPKRPIGKPYGVTVRHNQIFVCDTMLRTVTIMDLQKRGVQTFKPKGEGELILPINIAVDEDGTRYVTDTARGQVVVFSKEGEYKGAIGQLATLMPTPHKSRMQSPESTPSAKQVEIKIEMKPTDVLIAGDRLYVTDLKNQNVRVYNKADLKLMFTIPSEPITETNKLFQPTNLAMDPQGRLYVSDTSGFRVQQYAPDGKHLRQFGANGDSPGQFALNKGVAVDREGRIYVVDAKMEVCQIFDPEGRLLMWFGEAKGSDAFLTLPAKVAIDYDHVGLFQKYAAPGFELEHVVIITNQFGDRKVSIYGFGHKK